MSFLYCRELSYDFFENFDYIKIITHGPHFKNLMDIEMLLQDVLYIATDKFKRKLTYIINDNIAKTINFSSYLNEAFD